MLHESATDDDQQQDHDEQDEHEDFDGGCVHGRSVPASAAMILTVELSEAEARELLKCHATEERLADDIRAVPWDRANAMCKLHEALDKALYVRA
jgi:plasmid stability protein